MFEHVIFRDGMHMIQVSRFKKCETKITDPLFIQCWASVIDNGPTLN